MKISVEDQKHIVELLEKAPWKRSKRAEVRGMSVCGGLSYSTLGPSISKLEDPWIGIAQPINGVIKRTFGDHVFHWTSLMLNRDTVSETHTVANNLGPSLLFLLGEFSGGQFHIREETLTLSTTGKGVFFTGGLPHSSDEHEGRRYSIVAFSHRSLCRLTSQDKRRLLEVGFRFDYEAILRESPASIVDPSIAEHRVPEWRTSKRGKAEVRLPLGDLRRRGSARWQLMRTSDS